MRKVVLVRESCSHAKVVITGKTDERTRAAADVLVEYVRKATGAELEVVTESAIAHRQTEGIVLIRVGEAGERNEQVQAALMNLDADGFVIRTADGAIDIVGRSSWGTQFGVYEFLERYVGVRWLMPGDIGEDVPWSHELVVPEETIRQQPAFLSRDIDDTFGAEEWKRFNRLHRRIFPFHNLWNLFPPAKYKDSHPEFYPPKANLDSGEHWQPAFTLQATVDEAIRNINDYFDANREETCYSLGVNDCGGFVEDDPNHPDYPNRLNSLGHTDMSDIYFRWVNKVAEGVMRKHPDKYIGLYAYADVYDPTTDVKLHPNVVVYITDDRFSWEDPEMGAAGRKLTESWNKIAPSLGYYEYMYGGTYMLPRMYLHRVAESYQYALQNGVKAHFVEMWANFAGEGPKAWVMAKLQWNPHQSVDSLLAEWYERAVGPEAALDLACYFKHWERFWHTRSFDSRWFRNWKKAHLRTNYMAFYESCYLALVTVEEIAESRRLLESAVAKTKTEPQKERAKLMLRAFEYYEISALSYPTIDTAVRTADEETALLAVEQIELNFSRVERRYQLIEEFKTNPMLKLHMDPLGWGLKWTGMNGVTVASLIAWCRNHPEAAATVIDRAKRIAMESTEPYTRRFLSLLAILLDESGCDLNLSSVNAKDVKSTVAAASTEQADGIIAWMKSIKLPPEGRQATLSAERGPSGGRVVSLPGVQGGELVEAIRLEAGLYGIVMHFRANPGADEAAKLKLKLDMHGNDKRRLGTCKSERVMIQATGGHWSTLVLIAEIPAKIEGAEVHAVTLHTQCSLLQPQDTIEFEHAGVYRLDK
ncbi:DUF4838 domain-containing protein [Paenibacillus sp. MBLB4367]|uniref:DUF4838 domain-containing protein n=1 Tax=Paenibacillus sp. MBLB4367 TaxID=3384767 RepID=UPI00390844B6